MKQNEPVSGETEAKQLIAKARRLRSLSETIKSGSQVTEATIRAAMADAPLAPQQKALSLPKIREFVDKILAGEEAPAIKVDKGMIVEGNHRYVAGRITGKEPAIQPWAGGAPDRAIRWDRIIIDPASWE